jgi:hypothetical protein
MKQTAVEWLYLQMKKYCDDSNVPNDLLEQAKEIEEQQIEDAYEIGFDDGFDDGKYNNESKHQDGKDYYRKTYGGNK